MTRGVLCQHLKYFVIKFYYSLLTCEVANVEDAIHPRTPDPIDQLPNTTYRCFMTPAVSVSRMIPQVGYPVLTIGDDGSTSQTRFLAMGADQDGGEKTTWTIPTKVVWEGEEDGEGLVVMLEGGTEGGGEGGEKLKGKIQELQAAEKWYKVRDEASICLLHGVKSSTMLP